MKTKTIILCLLLGILAVVTACSSHDHSTGHGVEKDDKQISHYTCPMHPQIHEDHPGECPICHMRLVPVYKEGAKSDDGASLTIGTERQQLIGIKTNRATKKQVTKIIRTVGRVAFDAELAIAQKEFMEISENVPSLKKAARSRLRLLGMTDQEITVLARGKKSVTDLYLPSVGGTVWVYATLFPSEMALVSPGLAAKISLPAGADREFLGTVRGIDPVLDSTTRSTKARIEVTGGGGILKPDTYVNVALELDLGNTLTIPKDAVLYTGTRRVVFVMQEKKKFKMREVKLGAETENDVIVLSGIAEGEEVVGHAAFLVDSESQLKTAVSQDLPTCPEGQKWDVGMSMCMP